MAEEREDVDLDSPIEVNIQREPRVFGSLQELVDWERSEWDFSVKVAKPVRVVYDYLQPEQRNRYDHALNTLRADPLFANMQQYLHWVKTFSDRYILSDSVKGKFLADLQQTSEIEACAAFAYWRQVSKIEFSSPGWMAGVVRAVQFEQGIDTAAPTACAKALETRLSEFEAWYTGEQIKQQEHENSIKSLLENTKNENDIAVKFTDEQAAYVRGIFRRMKRIAKAASLRAQSQLGEQLDSIKDRYHTEIALLAPTQYWQSKEDYHTEQAEEYRGKFRLAFWISIVAVLLLSVMVAVPWEAAAVDLFTSDREPKATADGISEGNTDSQNKVTKGSGQVTDHVDSLTGEALTPGLSDVLYPVGKVTAFGAILALLFWYLRILSRNLHSHQHLATDAHERRVMVMTYLALLDQDRQVSPDHLGLILAGVFRPSADGLVKDEPGPSLFWSDIFKAMKQ